jgi:hypothetical protein
VDVNDDLQLESNELEKIETLLFERYLLNLEEDDSLSKKKKKMNKVILFNL